MSDFYMSTGDMRALKRFMKESPREFRHASAGVLNSLAFKTREYDIENITRSMIVRNPRFLRSGLKVTTARPQPINQQQSAAFSINRPRHTGWEEQQTGRGTMARTDTTAARGGSRGRQMQRKARLRPGSPIVKPSQYSTNTKNQEAGRFGHMLRDLDNKGGGNFILTRDVRTSKSRFIPGLWHFKKGKFSLLQDFRPARARRIPWRDQSINSLQVRNDMGEVWAENIRRVIAKFNKK